MRTAAMVMALLAVIGTEVGQAKQTEKQTVVVYVENGLAPMSVVRQAQGMAGKLFAGIGVTIDWRRGVPEDNSSPQERALAVRMASETPRNYLPAAVAASQPYEGVHITVFYDRVASRFQHHRSPLQAQALTSRLLAHVLVHEVSHMLQGISRHSPSGVMKAVWTPEDYRQMERRMLPFAPEDVHLIHGGAQARDGAKLVTANTSPKVAAP